jgi:hypothetical protein
VAGKLQEVLLDPYWEVGTVGIDGVEFGRMAFEHPRHGRIDVLLTLESVRGLSAALDRVGHDLTEKRLSAANA